MANESKGTYANPQPIAGPAPLAEREAYYRSLQRGYQKRADRGEPQTVGGKTVMDLLALLDEARAETRMLKAIVASLQYEGGGHSLNDPEVM